MVVRKLQIFTLFIALLYSCSSIAQAEFIENKGQWHDNVHYRSNFNSGSFFLEDGGFTVLLYNPGELSLLHAYAHGGFTKTVPETFTLHSFVYKAKFLGATKGAKAWPEKQLSSYNNYFLGNDKSKWAGDCKLFQAVTYQQIYPGIDIRYYTQDATLKYDLILQAGADIGKIKIQYDGPEKLTLKDGHLIVHTPVGEVKELSPYAFQVNEKGSEEIKVRYVLKGNVLSFDADAYDKGRQLIIDPTLIFSSFTGSTADNWGYTATPGRDGSFYSGGIVFGEGQYQVSAGAYDQTFNGGTAEGFLANGYDMAIFKFSPDGSQRLYATYLGGNSNEQPHSIIEDAQGNLIVAGRSNSSNYPLTRPQIGPGGAFDIVVTKLNAAGSALVGSIKMGGSDQDGVNIRPKTIAPDGVESLRRNYGDDARSEVITDASGNIIVVSCTSSSNFLGTLTTNIQQTIGGSQDGVILKFTPSLATTVFATYFGGTGNDACFVTAVNPINGNIYVGGATASVAIPGNKDGVIQPAFAGGDADGFVTIIAPDGSSAIKTTFLSGTGANAVDLVYGLKFDRLGFPYVMGTTTGNWPVQNAAYSDAGAKQFISKMRPDLSAYVYSTVFGRSAPAPDISPIAFLVDRCENVYVSGWGGGINDAYIPTSNTSGLPETNPIVGIPAADGKDFYMFVLEKNAASRLFASHFGQNGGTGDHVDGGTSRFDENGVIYQGICANCRNCNSCPSPVYFPTTSGVIFPNNRSTNCNQAAVKIEMNFAGVGAKLATDDSTKGCVPLTIHFKDLLQQGITYYWNFGDGSPIETTTTSVNSHTFTTVGTYTVMLIAEDLSKCNLRDTSYLRIIVSAKRASVGFTSFKLPPCENLTYQFTNTSTAVNGSFTNSSFAWDFGDGSAQVIAGTNTVSHTYAAPGTYTVRLFLRDTSFCNYPDSAVQTLRINPLVDARFSFTHRSCDPDTVRFINQSLAGQSFIWQFDNGTVFSTVENPVYIFTAPGTYRVRLIAIDPSTCNLRDTSDYVSIVVYPTPNADFDWGPNPPRTNIPVTFTNLSTGAVSYLWDFGDGSSSTDVNPIHEYIATGHWSVLLIATNSVGCQDSVRKTVSSLIETLVAVPNAFTPGKFGTNGIVMVKGYGIKRMKWDIYNRWGEKVFTSENKNQGWNGYYKGKLQPMDVYAYTLDVEFSDGQKLRKTGDITLLR